MIKSRELQKFYIKQFILNDNSLQEWIEANWNHIITDNAIIGYLFRVKQGVNFNQPAYVLNLYLIKREHYLGNEVTQSMFASAWKLFFNNINDKELHNKSVFLNPPIENWLDTKNNWCKKLAGKIATKFDWTFDEALSEVYLSIMKCYRRGDIYMGSLNYIERSVITSVLMAIRYNKNRVNLDSGLACSLNTSLGLDNNGVDITLADVIKEPESLSEDDIEYKSCLAAAKRILRPTFSEREIEQILTQKPGFLPRPTYSKLLRWREHHKIGEIYD